MGFLYKEILAASRADVMCEARRERKKDCENGVFVYCYTVFFICSSHCRKNFKIPIDQKFLKFFEAFRYEVISIFLVYSLFWQHIYTTFTNLFLNAENVQMEPANLCFIVKIKIVFLLDLL